MRKITLSLLLMLFPVMLWAAKVYRMPVTVTQSDGTQVTVTGYGDEDFHYYTTTDGVLLFHEGRDFFIAKVDATGNLMPTKFLAHESVSRTVEETEAIRMQDKNRFYSMMDDNVAKARIMREPIEYRSTLFPHSGNPKALVILVEFSDVKFTVNEPYKAFNQYLNADYIEDLGNSNRNNYGSVSKYFSDMSFGTFRPQFDVYGPVTLSYPLEHYGAGKDRMDYLIPDACAAVNDVVDFSQYDSNNDGNVDLVYVIYAGYSESWSGNSSDCIWPKSGTINGGTYDGVSVYRYGVNNELNGVEGQQIGQINGIGLFCHEFSHCIGLPDLYVTTSAPAETQNADNQEMEYWSVMDSGTYLRNGYAPPAYTAWEREAFGWFDIDVLNDAQFVELKPIDDGGKAYRILNDNDPTGNEYYILENIQNNGWNTRQYGHGMLVTHVDYDKNIFSSNLVNNTLGHPRMTVLAADGCLDNSNKFETSSALKTAASGDPFPGIMNVTELTDETTVKPIIYTGERLNKPIYDIKEDTATGVVSFCFLDRNVVSVENAIVDKLSSKDNRIYTIDGRCVGTNPSIIKKGIYIINNKKVVF